MIAVSDHHGQFADEAAVYAVPLPEIKDAGRNFVPVKHGDLIDTIKATADARGWSIANGKFALTKDTLGLAAAWDLTIPGMDPPGGQSFGLGLLTANDRHKKLKLVVGTRVFCCNNGACTGEVVLSYTHTKGANLAGSVDEGFGRYVIAAEKVAALVAQMRETEIAPKVANDVLMEAGRRKLMPWSRIGAVDAEFRKPTFAEQGTGTAWAMFSAFTYVIQRCPPQTQMPNQNRFRELLMTTAA